MIGCIYRDTNLLWSNLGQGWNAAKKLINTTLWYLANIDVWRNRLRRCLFRWRWLFWLPWNLWLYFWCFWRKGRPGASSDASSSPLFFQKSRMPAVLSSSIPSAIESSCMLFSASTSSSSAE